MPCYYFRRCFAYADARSQRAQSDAAILLPPGADIFRYARHYVLLLLLPA